MICCSYKLFLICVGLQLKVGKGKQSDRSIFLTSSVAKIGSEAIFYEKEEKKELFHFRVILHIRKQELCKFQEFLLKSTFSN